MPEPDLVRETGNETSLIVPVTDESVVFVMETLPLALIFVAETVPPVIDTVFILNDDAISSTVRALITGFLSPKLVGLPLRIRIEEVLVAL